MSPKRIVTFTLAVALLLTIGYVETASAQCAMCRTALDQEGGQLAAGFNRAILFLLGMPYLVFGAIVGTYFWKRRKAGGALGNEGLAK